MDHIKSAAHVDHRNSQTSSVMLLEFHELDDMEYLDDLNHRQALMREIAKRIKPAVRGADILAHLEGFRFGTLAQGVTEDQATDFLLSRFIESLGAPLSVGDHKVDLKKLSKTRILGLNKDTLASVMEQV